MRGISPIIASILLILFVVISALAFYFWYMSVQSSIQETKSFSPSAISIDEVFCENGYLHIILRNLYDGEVKGTPTVKIRDKGAVIGHYSCSSPVTIAGKASVTLSPSSCDLNIPCCLPSEFDVFVGMGSAVASKSVSLDRQTYRRKVTITNSSGSSLSDYQVLVTINTNELISDNKMCPDCRDIHFTDADGNPLPYWVENCNDVNTKIWVKVPQIPANSSTTIYLFYGNLNANGESNVDSVFDSFDETKECVVTTDGDSCSVTFSVSDAKFVSGTMSFWKKGDFNQSDEYATVYINGENIGNYRTGFRDCTYRQPNGWPKDISSYIADTSSVTATADGSSSVDWEWGCPNGTFYKWRLIAKTRKYVDPEPSVSVQSG